MSITGSLASTIGQLNPFRYRGYYYDNESGLYYLQSRYYDSVTSRFVNSDGIVQTGQGVLDKNMFAYCGNNPINRADSSGQLWGIIVGVTLLVGLVASLSGCSSKPTSKAPANYVANNSKEQNCYGYAFGLPHAANPGGYSIDKKSPDYMYKNKKSYSPKEIANYVKRDMKALNKSVREVSNPSEKNYNEYIVAMKTSTIIIPEIDVADYHFAVQLSDGTWADKPGTTASRWNKIDGEALTWDLGMTKHYYNTESIYFAVEK